MGFATIGVVLAIAGAIVLWRVVARARALSAQSKALEADRLEPRSNGASVAVARATHLRTLIGSQDACLPNFQPNSRGELIVTDREIVLTGAWHIPLTRVSEASFVASFEHERAGYEAILMRLSWRRADRSLVTIVRVDGRRVDAERIRKEVHLRVAGPPFG